MTSSRPRAWSVSRTADQFDNGVQKDTAPAQPVVAAVEDPTRHLRSCGLQRLCDRCAVPDHVGLVLTYFEDNP